MDQIFSRVFTRLFHQRHPQSSERQLVGNGSLLDANRGCVISGKAAEAALITGPNCVWTSSGGTGYFHVVPRRQITEQLEVINNLFKQGNVHVCVCVQAYKRMCARLLMDETCLFVDSRVTGVDSSCRGRGCRSWPHWLVPWKAKVFACDMKTFRLLLKPHQMHTDLCVCVRAAFRSWTVWKLSKQKRRRWRCCREPRSSCSVSSLDLLAKKKGPWRGRLRHCLQYCLMSLLLFSSFGFCNFFWQRNSSKEKTEKKNSENKRCPCEKRRHCVRRG